MNELHVIPRLIWFWRRAITIWWPWRREPRIYVPRNYGRAPALVRAHEQVHVRQWRRLGRLGFLKRYMTQTGRLELEAEAFAGSVKYWAALGVVASSTGASWLDYYADALHREYGDGIAAMDARAAIARWLA